MNDTVNPPVVADQVRVPDPALAASPVAKPADDKGDAVGKLQSLIKSTANFLSLSFQEWLPALLIDPKNPPFKYDEPLNTQMDRLARLITIVCILSGIVVGGALFIPSVTPWALIATSVGLLIRVFVATIVYKPVTYLFGIRMSTSGQPLTVQQVFFIACYSFLPWTPIITALWAAYGVAQGTTDLLIIFIYILCVGWICHTAARLINVLTGCSLIRSWLAVATPVLGFFLLSFLYPLIF